LRNLSGGRSRQLSKAAAVAIGPRAGAASRCIARRTRIRCAVAQAQGARSADALTAAGQVQRAAAVAVQAAAANGCESVVLLEGDRGAALAARAAAEPGPPGGSSPRVVPHCKQGQEAERNDFLHGVRSSL